jgi:hypothetical protein
VYLLFDNPEYFTIWCLSISVSVELTIWSLTATLVVVPHR